MIESRAAHPASREPSRGESRREFLRALGAGAGAALVGPGVLAGLAGCRSSPSESRERDLIGWDRVPDILRRIVPPTFAARDFDVTRYGARGDGVTDCTRAFFAAVAACSSAGGGRVVVPAGRFLTGPVHLRSNVNLHVTRGATIAFSQDPRAYLPAVFTRWEGMELMGYSPFIYAFEQENVAITGEGMLDGQADAQHWWPWKGNADSGYRKGEPNQLPARSRLMQLMEQGEPVARRLFADGSYLRPQFIQPYRCRNVLIEDVAIVNSPMWEIHPVLCTNVTVRGVRITSHGPNNDGCDPESCRDVLIENCLFDTGDDCIAIKSGRNTDGRRLATPTENVIVRGCRMRDGHGGVTVGSEISGNVRHVYVERCEMDSPNLERALRVKTNAMRGGRLEHIYARDLTVGELSDAVLQVDFHYEEGERGAFLPVVRDIEMRNVTSRKSAYGLYLRAFSTAPITDVRLQDCDFADVAKGNVVEHVRGLALARVRINGRDVDAATMPRAGT
jgi:polygalacturonase